MSILNGLWDFVSLNRRNRSNYSNSSRSTFSQDDPFWNSYNQLGSRYKTQLDPYLNYNYHTGAWDKIGNWLGFNTAEDRYRMEMQDRAIQALSGFLTDEFQNQYNSQQEQAQRQRDAGLNPDLAGEATGEQASGLEQPLAPIDPSIFDTPQSIVSPIVSALGTSFSALQGVGAFASALSDVTLNKENAKNVAKGRPGIEIQNWSQAWDAAGKWLQSTDPYQYLDIKPLSDDLVGTQAGIEQLTPSFVEASSKAFDWSSEETQKLFRRAVQKQMGNPENAKIFWDNYNEAVKSHFNQVAGKEVYGAINTHESQMWQENYDLLNYYTATMRDQYELENMRINYNLLSTQNDFDFESFKQKYNIPQAVNQADFARYIQTMAESLANTSKFTYLRKTLDRLWKLQSGNRADRYTLYGLLMNGNYAPLMNNSIRGVSTSRFPLSLDDNGYDKLETAFGGVTNGSGNSLIDASDKIEKWLRHIE